MKSTKLLTALLILCLSCTLPSCNKNDDPAEDSSLPVAESIIGNWLLSTSDDTEWTCYEFTEMLMTSEWMTDGEIHSGKGHYFTNDEKASLTGTVAEENGQYTYIDWIITKISPFQIDLKIYGDNGNQYAGAASLYKIVGSQAIESHYSLLPNYRAFTGTNDCSEFRSLDNSIATVDQEGRIVGVNQGTTYVVFTTPAGGAAIKVEVSGKILTFSEKILGVWVSDNLGYIWEKDEFGPDGYYFGQWSREVIYPTKDETAQGSYTVDEEAMTISLKAQTPYGQKLDSEYRISTIDKFSFNADIYSGGEKTGSFYYQKVLSSVILPLGETIQPDYSELVGGSTISGYAIHDTKIATVDASTGLVTPIADGFTYVDIKTNNGTAVVEIKVEEEVADLFPDYSALLGMTRKQVTSKMGRTPDLEDEQSQSFFFFDNKGIVIVSAYYTDFVEIFDNVHSLVVMLDDTLSKDTVIDYLKKKYNYQSNFSTDKELVFAPDDQSMEIYYTPESKMIMYFSSTSRGKVATRANINSLKSKVKALNR